MKSARFIALCMFAATLMAQAETNTVTSANVVGYNTITMPAAGWIIVGYNFDTEDGLTLNNIFGTNQLAQHDFNPNLCDQVITWNTNTFTYQAWAQKTDGIFYKASDMGQFLSNDTGTVSEITVTPGLGMWLINSAATNKAITFSGDVVASQTQQVSIVSGWQMMCYPLSSDATLSGTDLVGSGAAAHDFNPQLCDQIIVWSDGAYQAYAPKTDGIWYKANDMGEFLSSIPASNIVSIGQGFWYIAQGSMIWTESNKYYNNIK